MEGVKTWLSSQVADFLEIGIQKLCCEAVYGCTYFFIYIYFFLVACFVNSSPEFTF
jgi:hypothetical protein